MSIGGCSDEAEAGEDKASASTDCELASRSSTGEMERFLERATLCRRGLAEISLPLADDDPDASLA